MKKCEYCSNGVRFNHVSELLGKEYDYIYYKYLIDEDDEIDSSYLTVGLIEEDDKFYISGDALFESCVDVNGKKRIKYCPMCGRKLGKK